MIRLSIITATRNLVKAGREAAIRRCMESVAQLPFAHEHIICDGASSDGTLELLQALAKNNPNARIFSKPDSGVYEAFNNGVRQARGEWLYFLGSDDRLFSPENLIEALELAERADAAMAISPVRQSDGKLPFRDMGDCGNILIIKPYCHQGVLMRKPLVEELGLFDTNYTIASDFKLCLQAHLADARHVFSGKAYACFSTDGGLSQSPATERRERLEIAADVLEIPEKARALLYARQLLPWKTITRLLFHRNAVIRQGARYAIARRIAGIAGMLDEKGGPRTLPWRKA